MKKNYTLLTIALFTALFSCTACSKDLSSKNNLITEETTNEFTETKEFNTYMFDSETSDDELEVEENLPIEPTSSFTFESASNAETNKYLQENPQSEVNQGTTSKAEASTTDSLTSSTTTGTISPTKPNIIVPTNPATTSPTTSTEASSQDALSSTSVYNAMVAYKTTYPEGTYLTNESFYYAWKGGIYSGGYGCAGFAFMLSDSAFGNLPARKYSDLSQIKIGDIIRVSNDTHSVIVLSIDDSGITIAEGNYNSSVHWGRKISFNELRGNSNNSFTYGMTRYPQ